MQNSTFMPQPAEVREHSLDGESPELAPFIIQPVSDPDCKKCRGTGSRDERYGPSMRYTRLVDCSCVHMPITTDRLLTLTQVRRMGGTDPEGARAYVQSHWDRYYAVGHGYPELLKYEGYLERPALPGKAQDALCEGKTI